MPKECRIVFLSFLIIILVTYTCYANQYYNSWYSPKPIHLAVLNGDINEVERILKNDPSQLEARDGLRYTPIYYAIFANKVQMVEFLLSKGANLNIKSLDGLSTTPLIYAIYNTRYRSIEEKKSRIEIFKLLVENGADIKLKDSKGRSSIHYVAQMSAASHLQLSKPYMEILISHKVDINERDRNGNTPLMYAAACDDVQVAETLVEHGADINIADNSGNTPLHIAAKFHFEMLHYLLSKNAKTDVRTNQGMTPLHTVLEFGVTEYIMHPDAKREFRDHIRKRAILLIDHKAPVNVQDNKGMTPLHYAVDLNDVTLVKRLLQAGADITIKDNRGETPVNYARACYNTRLINLFNTKK